MNFVIRQKLADNPRNLLRDCGYQEIHDRKTGKNSFVRRLRGDFYPRFHVYIAKAQPELLEISMHLDMKRPVYEGFTAHSGEYDGELVENEAARMKEIIINAKPPVTEEPEKKSFLGKLFGTSSSDDE